MRSVRYVLGALLLCLVLPGLVKCKQGSAPSEQSKGENKQETVYDSPRSARVPAGPLGVGSAPPPPPPPPLPLGPSWNIWFERDGKYEQVLSAGKSYSLILDLSRYQYIIGQGTELDTAVKESIKQAGEAGARHIKFVIRVILHGGILSLAGSGGASQVLDVSLDKLQGADPGTAALLDPLDLKSSLPEFARKVQAGHVKFDLVAQRQGCGGISVSIWNETGQVPLDHIIQPVTVSDREGRMPECTVYKGMQTKGGLPSLLEASLDFASEGSLTADAAFHIFEPSPNGRSVVVYCEAAPQVKVFAWETESKLSHYLEKEEQLQSKLHEARSKASKGQEYGYEEVASELRMKIFGGLEENDRTQAGEAYDAFRDLVSSAKERPLVFVRMRNERGRAVYLPIGILAAKSRNPILPKPLVVVQPLPRERYPATRSCIDPWALGVPERLEGLAGGDLEAFRPSSSSWITCLRDLASLRGFLASSSPLDPGAKPEGVVLLAHHSDGNIWFDKRETRIIPEQVSRLFPPGSIALLSACSVGDTKGDNAAILEKLNRNGVDAMIISPFPVKAEYGTRFALSFIEVLEEARKKSARASLAELFVQASEKTTSHFREHRGWNMEDTALEFMIAGDFRIALCAR